MVSESINYGDRTFVVMFNKKKLFATFFNMCMKHIYLHAYSK